jgi:hypothetical protein
MWLGMKDAFLKAFESGVVIEAAPEECQPRESWWWTSWGSSAIGSCGLWKA